MYILFEKPTSPPLETHLYFGRRLPESTYCWTPIVWRESQPSAIDTDGFWQPCHFPMKSMYDVKGMDEKRLQPPHFSQASYGLAGLGGPAPPKACGAVAGNAREPWREICNKTQLNQHICTCTTSVFWKLITLLPLLKKHRRHHCHRHWPRNARARIACWQRHRNLQHCQFDYAISIFSALEHHPSSQRSSSFHHVSRPPTSASLSLSLHTHHSEQSLWSKS